MPNLNKAPVELLTGDNWFNNETSQEIEFVVNGRDMNIKNLKLEGLQCTTGVCQ